MSEHIVTLDVIDSPLEIQGEDLSLSITRHQTPGNANYHSVYVTLSLLGEGLITTEPVLMEVRTVMGNNLGFWLGMQNESLTTLRFTCSLPLTESAILTFTLP
jgi:hypothetical protein